MKKKLRSIQDSKRHLYEQYALERLIWKPIEHEKRFMTRNWYKPKMFMLSLLHRQSREKVIMKSS